MRNRMKALLIPVMPAVVFGVLFTGSCMSDYPAPDPGLISQKPYRANVSVHDPSIIAGENGEYYIFGSHMDSARSTDLIHWETYTRSVSRYNKLFDNLFTDLKAFDYVGRNADGGYSVWAPDVVYNRKTEKYVMYFCTTSTYIKSNLCIAVSDKVEGPYHYLDTIVYSGFTPETIAETNVLDYVSETEIMKYFSVSRYNNMLWPNAIDPAVFYDAAGKMRLTYGSWSGGIFILEIDEETGRPVHPEEDPESGTDRYFGRHIAGGFHNSIEGPYIIYDELSGYYYLFVSYGSLVSNGGYQIRLFRSDNPDGPYTDTAGQSSIGVAFHDKFGLKVMGNYTLPSLIIPYMSPGHNSAFIDTQGRIFLVCHVRFDDGTELHEPRVHQMFRTSNGWLAAAPFAYAGETLREGTYKPGEAAGYYYMINHGTDISAHINGPRPLILNSNGKLYNEEGKPAGTWKLGDRGPAISLLLDGTDFEGVVLEQNDEAGNAVMAFTAVSGMNTSIWGIRYLQEK